jgi:hypothetical protein
LPADPRDWREAFVTRLGLAEVTVPVAVRLENAPPGMAESRARMALAPAGPTDADPVITWPSRAAPLAAGAAAVPLRSSGTVQRDWKTALVTNLGATTATPPNAALRLSLPATARVLPNLSNLAQ